MVNNLVKNAIQHMGRAGKIVIGVRRQSQGLRIEVWDNGLGIPESEQSHLFQPFYRSDRTVSSRHHHKGVGLGLSIVKQFADLLECRVGFRSEEGKGCYFSLSFPKSTESLE
jgi:signal transduction histidine kinase